MHILTNLLDHRIQFFSNSVMLNKLNSELGTQNKFVKTSACFFPLSSSYGKNSSPTSFEYPLGPIVAVYHPTFSLSVEFF